MKERHTFISNLCYNCLCYSWPKTSWNSWCPLSPLCKKFVHLLVYRWVHQMTTTACVDLNQDRGFQNHQNKILHEWRRADSFYFPTVKSWMHSVQWTVVSTFVTLRLFPWIQFSGIPCNFQWPKLQGKTDFIYNFIYTMDNRLTSWTILASARLSSPVKPVGTVSPAVQWRAPVHTLGYWPWTPLLWITSEHIWATNATGLRITYLACKACVVAQES